MTLNLYKQKYLFFYAELNMLCSSGMINKVN